MRQNVIFIPLFCQNTAVGVKQQQNVVFIAGRRVDIDQKFRAVRIFAVQFIGVFFGLAVGRNDRKARAHHREQGAYIFLRLGGGNRRNGNGAVFVVHNIAAAVRRKNFAVL